jgi:maltooligosyltrehalose synthase
VSVPSGTWADLLTGTTHTSGGELALADVLAERPVALLVRVPVSPVV